MTKRGFLTGFLLAAGFVAVSGDAYAQQKVGDVIENMTRSTGNVDGVLSTIAYLSGGYLSANAIFKFKDHVDNPQQTKISDPVKRLLAGGMFFSLPYMLSTLRTSMFGSRAGNFGTSTPDVSGVTPDALDGMVIAFVRDIYGPMSGLLTAFSYLAGIALLLVGISRLTKSAQEGPRGPAGFGTIMTFLAAGGLFSLGSSMGVFSSSLFGNPVSSIEASIDSTHVLADADDRQRIEAVISGLMGFILIVGYVAFIRGWFVLKNFADGQQGATLAQGLTFLLGGALAINLGELINALQATLGISGITFT